MNNILVCFPGGAGGHFIGNVCSKLLFNKSSQILKDGSMHDSRFYYHAKSLEGRIFDKSEISYQQELAVIQDLENFEISVGHFRYVDELVKIGKRVIYITFDYDDKQIIYNRLSRKNNPLDISEQHYEAIKGTGWPTYKEFQQGKGHEEILTDSLEKDWLNDWFYKLPDDSTNICEIKFKELLTGDSLLIKLSSFLNIPVITNNTQQLIDQYRKLQ